jgi:hypothetical protein
MSFAVEFNFDDICRLLIEEGTNSACIFDNNGKSYDSYLFCAVWFRAQKILETLLTNFKDKIRPIIDERCGEDKQTVAHLFFKVDYNLIYQYSVNKENFEFIEHFIHLFRNAGAGFDIPDIRNNGTANFKEE